VIVVLIGLVILNRRPDLQVGWFRNELLQKYWLPAVALLLYLLFLIGFKFLELLVFDQVVSYFPDIDDAWQEATKALAQAGIRLTEMPLFLIVGRPEAAQRNVNLFEAAKLQAVVRPTPQDPRGPLQVWADREAVYVSCAGVSLLGRLAGILALEEMGQAAEGEAEGQDIDVTKTLIPTKKESQLVEELGDARDGELTTLERRRLRRQIRKPLGPDFLADAKEVREISDRLGHLCRLIGRDRQPYCPINGILLLLPLGGTDTPADAQQTAEACRLDLDTLRAVFTMNCPLLALVCDMEVLPGFRECMRLDSARDSNYFRRRVGQRFPLANNLRGDELLAQARASIQWLNNGYLQSLVYKYFNLESAAGSDAAAMMAANASLFLFLDEMHDRTKRLADIISQFLPSKDQDGWFYGGCYLGATGGRDEQAYVPGLFKRLVEEQNCVAWTPRALANDAKCHAQTRLGYTLLWSAAGLLIVALIGWLAFHKSRA